MGEAARRGTREQRKADAIAAGRIKRPAKKLPPRETIAGLTVSEASLQDVVAGLMIGAIGSPKQIRRMMGLRREAAERKTNTNVDAVGA